MLNFIKVLGFYRIFERYYKNLVDSRPSRKSGNPDLVFIG